MSVFKIEFNSEKQKKIKQVRISLDNKNGWENLLNWQKQRKQLPNVSVCKKYCKKVTVRLETVIGNGQ